MRTIIKSNYEELPRYVDVILGQRYKQDKNEFLQEESFRSSSSHVFTIPECSLAEVFYGANYRSTNYHVKKYVKESQFLLFSRQKVYKNANSLET